MRRLTPRETTVGKTYWLQVTTRWEMTVQVEVVKTFANGKVSVAYKGKDHENMNLLRYLPEEKFVPPQEGQHSEAPKFLYPDYDRRQKSVARLYATKP
jgi:hypothetical protein